MTPRVGFALVTYNNPEQTLRLCLRLNELFGAPPIAIHHDVSQSSLSKSRFPSNVAFVSKQYTTQWGSITVVDALLSTLRLLQAEHDPDWVTSLSSSDYPIQDAETMLSDLQRAPYDVYMDMREIRDLGQRFVNEGLGEQAFQHPRFVQSAFNRYMAFRLLKPTWAARIKQPHEAWVLRSKALVRTTTPFNNNLRCYAGDSWFTAGRRALSVMLDETAEWKQLHRHFANRSIPEESFLHTVIGNTPGLRICHDSLRYTDWRGCYAHPRVLGRGDFDRLLQSTKHFARKFPDDAALMADWNRVLANKQTRDVAEFAEVAMA